MPATLWESWCDDCGTHFIATERQTKLCDSCGKGRGYPDVVGSDGGGIGGRESLFRADGEPGP